MTFSNRSNRKYNLTQKPKPLSENKPAEVKELQTLTMAELNAIAGAGLELSNHNETMVSLI